MKKRNIELSIQEINIVCGGMIFSTPGEEIECIIKNVLRGKYNDCFKASIEDERIMAKFPTLM
jgi:hypothetical protein